MDPRERDRKRQDAEKHRQLIDRAFDRMLKSKEMVERKRNKEKVVSEKEEDEYRLKLASEREVITSQKRKKISAEHEKLARTTGLSGQVVALMAGAVDSDEDVDNSDSNTSHERNSDKETTRKRKKGRRSKRSRSSKKKSKRRKRKYESSNSSSNSNNDSESDSACSTKEEGSLQRRVKRRERDKRRYKKRRAKREYDSSDEDRYTRRKRKKRKKRKDSIARRGSKEQELEQKETKGRHK